MHGDRGCSGGRKKSGARLGAGMVAEGPLLSETANSSTRLPLRRKNGSWRLRFPTWMQPNLYSGNDEVRVMEAVCV
jgi:hypothetical protein